MSLPSGKAFAAEPASLDLRMDQAAAREKLFHDLVDSINCFEPVSWSALAKDVLLPWASSSRGRSKLLLDLMRDLVGLGEGPDGRVMGLALLGRLLPYLEESAREKLLAFIGMQQTSH